MIDAQTIMDTPTTSGPPATESIEVAGQTVLEEVARRMIAEDSDKAHVVGGAGEQVGTLTMRSVMAGMATPVLKEAIEEPSEGHPH